MSEPGPNCVICTKERPAIHGFLCVQHYERIATWLHEIEVETAHLSPLKSMQVATGNRGAGLASHRSPARLDVIVALDSRRGTGIPLTGDPDPWGFDDTASVLDVLGSWARMVREERELASPDRVTVMSERRTLTAQWDWICAQPWVDEMVGELKQLRSQLKASNGTQDEKPYGRCYLPSVDPKVPGTCDGPIWLDLAMGHAHCGKCRQTWDGGQLVTLKGELDRAKAELARPKTDDGRRMLTVTELATKHKKTENAIRLRLSKAGARAVRGHYDPAVLDEASKSCA